MSNDLIIFIIVFRRKATREAILWWYSNFRNCLTNVCMWIWRAKILWSLLILRILHCRISILWMFNLSWLFFRSLIMLGSWRFDQTSWPSKCRTLAFLSFLRGSGMPHQVVHMSKRNVFSSYLRITNPHVPTHGGCVVCRDPALVAGQGRARPGK